MATDIQQVLKGLKYNRGATKSSLTRFKTYLESIDGTNFNATNLKKRLSRAEALYSEFHDSNGQIQMMEHESNNEIDVQDFDDHYFEVIAKAEDILTLGSSNKPNIQSPSEELRHETNSQVRLPQITLPQFSWAFDEWVPFNETFNSLIHSNEGIGTVQKFHYLRSSLKGEAANCISELQITAKNYEIAWAALRERYDNRKLIIRKHIQAIHELPICKDENLSFLRQILDGVQKHTRSLKALDRPVEYWDDWLLYLICNKIDHVSNKEWESSIKGDKIPTFKELIEFLSHKCCTLESISQSALPSRIHQRNPQRVPLVHVTSQNTQCAICKSNHYIYNCPKFLQMSAEQRISQIKKTRCCFNCLNSGHVSSKCKGSSCKICHQRHNTLLHLSNSNSANQQSQISMSQGESSQVITTHASRVSHSQVVLSTAIVKVKDSSGTFHNCRALLDSGSQSNFISKALIQKLKLKTKSINLPVSGIGQSQTQINHVSEVIVRSSYNAFKMPLSCLILDNITNEIPVDPFNRSALNIRKNLKLADPEFHIPRKIDLLIGAEFFWQLLCVGQIKVENTGLIMQKTHLGWVISGPITCSKLLPRVTNCNVSSMQSLETAITKFWEIEELSSKGAYSLDEAECENHFRNSYKRNHEGRFIVKLPVNADPNQALGESKQIAIRRLNSLENKLSKQPDLRDQYNSFMQEYIELGHMRQINDHEIQNHENASFYLPHHAVVKGDSITTKLRVVFDGSAKSSSGHSLNDILMVGPSVQQDLFSITCRFRSHRIVLTADITKMYRQVLVAPSQTRLQRIVWRFNPSQNIETYELNTVTYGTASAPFLATRALNQLAIEESNALPLGAKISLRDFYVDDLLTGADSVQEIHQIFAEVTELLARGGFSLRKWASNRMDILSALLPNAVEPTILNLEQDGSIKTLGLQWDSGSDRLQYKIPEVTISKRLNKRNILSQVAQIFDPLGLIGPVIATAKMFIQRLWQLKLSWDESLPLQLHTEWFNFQDVLPQLRSLRAKRCVIPYKHRVEIHGFCDASEKGYGACIYVRSITNSGLVSSELLCSKSRVAPLKATTIPRLELCAALLLAQLLHKVLPSLEVEINQVYYWTDSTIVIGWINTTARQLKPFVANRVGEIQELTNISNWNHVGTNDNPADILSRGTTPNYLIDNSLWWHGPPWLMEAQENWPRSIINVTELEIPEKRSIPAVNAASTVKNWNIITKYSSFQRLQRVLAYCQRFINNLHHSVKGQHCNINTGPLAVHELEDATIWLVRSVQKEVFPDEVNRLRNNQPIKPESKLKSLNPIIDDKHVMRVGGRLRNAPAHFNKKFPIILPDKHVFTKLLIKQTHCEELHAGAQATLAKLRNKFWPISGRNLVRQVVRNCVTCFKVNPRAYQPIMGDLPKARLEPSRPFIRTGVDYCGPFLIRSHTRRKTSPSKAYVAIFICMATKAVHIELATSLNTDSFLNALKRFISRRGMVSQMYSDNGSNFVRANKELKELSTMFEGAAYNKIVDTLSNKGITWHFNPPRAPHFGGIWEAAVKSFKYHFKRIVGNVSLTIEEMNTVIAQIEACLNSRPLIPLSDDPDDLSVITPAHFLIGDSLTVNLEPNLLPLNINRLSRLQLLDRLKQHFWQRWSKEYLQQLQQRSKWTRSRGAAPQPGQLVIIKEDNLPPLLWSMGRVVSVHPGKDGITRAATIKTTRGEVKRPANKLCVLACDNERN